MKKTVLVVDDSLFDRELLVRALAKKGDFITIEVGSAESCLECLASRPIDIILLDILMPGITGIELLKKVRDKFNAIELPVIMVTSKTDTSDIVDCLQNGANDYIKKPVNFEVAVSRILTHLKVSEISDEMSRLKEVAALGAMVTTYNHEINNPLAIAIACLGLSDLNEDSTRAKLKSALWRIADIVKKIQSATENNEIKYESYVDSVKMFKVK